MKCSFCDKTSEECRVRKVKDFYLCPKHYTRYYRHQDMYGISIYDRNEYVLFDDHAEIILCDKYCLEVGRAIIDLDDVERCKEYKWHIKRSSGRTDYVIGSKPKTDGKKIFLHRVVMNYYGHDLDIDHINKNGFDNRKSNLRLVTHSQNSSNNWATGVRQTLSGKYSATCTRNYKSIWIGCYDTYDEAVAARKAYIDSIDY